jgi:phosphoribosyl 1,2-cyclic phosphodiesterase
MANEFLVTFWGTRGSIATPGRSTEKYGGNTACVSVRIDDSLYIFDAGTGIRPLGVEVMRDCIPEEGKMELSLFLSHTHWDHIQGMPFFQPAYHPSFSLNIYGTSRKGALLENLLVGQMDSNYFPVKMSTLGAEMAINEIAQGKPLSFDNADITFQELDHPGGSLSIKLKAKGKTIIYATDHELNNQFTEDGELINDDQLGREYMEFIEGADLLIADGQYTSEEYKVKKGWGHTSVPALLNVAQKCNVKQVAVYHHDPMHTDSFIDELSAKYLQHFQDTEPRLEIFWAREGLTLAI